MKGTKHVYCNARNYQLNTVNSIVLGRQIKINVMNVQTLVLKWQSFNPYISYYDLLVRIIEYEHGSETETTYCTEKYGQE